MAKYTDQQLKDAVSVSQSVRETLGRLGLKDWTGNYRQFYKKVDELGIDTSHFRGRSHLKGRTHNWNGKPLAEILVKNSSYTNTTALKNRLIKANLLRYECYICSITEWLDQPLVLQLDHINGTHNDHRLHNLRLLCPNCHSQTKTFCGKNAGAAPRSRT